jgi:hypothetical protein
MAAVSLGPEGVKPSLQRCQPRRVGGFDLQAQAFCLLLALAQIGV